MVDYKKEKNAIQITRWVMLMVRHCGKDKRIHVVGSMNTAIQNVNVFHQLSVEKGYIIVVIVMENVMKLVRSVFNIRNILAISVKIKIVAR